MSRCNCSVGNNYPGIDHSDYCPLALDARIKELEAENKRLREAGRGALEYLKEMKNLEGVKYVRNKWIFNLTEALLHTTERG